jgi:hypothetical protein
MRICPVCNYKLNEYSYFFCENCRNALPQGLFKLPKPILLNLRLKYEISPTYKFLFFKIPYENRFSAQLITAILLIFISFLLAFYLFNQRLWL